MSYIPGRGDWRSMGTGSERHRVDQRHKLDRVYTASSHTDRPLMTCLHVTDAPH